MRQDRHVQSKEEKLVQSKEEKLVQSKEELVQSKEDPIVKESKKRGYSLEAVTLIPRTSQALVGVQALRYRFNGGVLTKKIIDRHSLRSTITLRSTKDALVTSNAI